MKKPQNKPDRADFLVEKIFQGKHAYPVKSEEALRKGEEERKETCSCGYRHYGCECDDVCEDCGDKIIKTDYPDFDPQPEKMQQTAEGIEQVRNFLFSAYLTGKDDERPSFADWDKDNKSAETLYKIIAESQLAQYKEKVLNLIDDEYGESEMIGERILHGIKEIIKNS